MVHVRFSQDVSTQSDDTALCDMLCLHSENECIFSTLNQFCLREPTYSYHYVVFPCFSSVW